MALRGYGHVFVQPTMPAEDPVMVGSIWSDTATGLMKVCTSISPYTFVTASGGSIAWSDITSFAGSSLAQLATRSATDLTTGTLPDARFPAVLPAIGGANLTGLLASQIGSGATLSRTSDTNVTLTLGGSPAAALLTAVSLTLGWTGTLGLVRGGTGADLSGTGGAGKYLKQASAGAAVTVTSITAAEITSGAILSKVDDTNVTLTLGGAPTTALLTAASLSLGWTGTLAPGRGGTGIGSYAVGDMLYADGAASLTKLAAVAVGSLLGSAGLTTAPAWQTAGTLSTSLTTPKLIGGTGTTSTLTMQATSGAGTTGADFLWKVGTNGATQAMQLTNAAQLLIGTPSTHVSYGSQPTQAVHVVGAPQMVGDYISADVVPFALRGRKARGTLNSPTKALSGDNLVQFIGQAWEDITPGWTSGPIGTVGIQAAEDITATQQGGKLIVNLVTIGGVVNARQLTITSSAFTLGTCVSPAGSGTYPLQISTAGVVTSTQSIGALNGGTGLTSLAQGDLVYGSAANTYSPLTKDANATRYLSNQGTSNSPSWNQVNMANGTVGIPQSLIVTTANETLTAGYSHVAPRRYQIGSGLKTAVLSGAILRIL